ncbi:RNA polymerase Rpb4 family protein [Candidatus Methanocrinis natronophilus]|uniref:DNA-directed RNA polymerase subunit Rpo4 n=1 Tax=Candidatus Methanocrinis natronophilus TaxID=3033396 RepID=A0ABT5X4X8_9EURY|nr:RNA polymerase Rpb4 family protein [Candidatus Methanocrinis natronophilus]MDF0589708.1 RNA polymerase Rpb4 family protein [Candidatus Methanocrinis natronophilus]
MSEELMTLSDVREALEEIRLRRAEEPEELGYELRRAIKHADIFSQGTAGESHIMREELLGLQKMTPEIATKITDVRPKTKDEIRALYAKERFTLSEEDLDAILDVVLRA